MSVTVEKNCNTCMYDDVGTFFMSEGTPYPRCEQCHGAVETYTKWAPKWPPPEKEYNPEEPVTITLPARLWVDMLPFLHYITDWNRARQYWWTHSCKDGKLGAANAKDFEQAADKAEKLCKVIETAILEDKTNEPTET